MAKFHVSGIYPVPVYRDTLAEISKVFRDFVEERMLSSELAPYAKVFDEDGMRVGTVAYNGKIFKDLNDFMAEPLYNPFENKAN